MNYVDDWGTLETSQITIPWYLEAALGSIAKAASQADYSVVSRSAGAHGYCCNWSPHLWPRFQPFLLGFAKVVQDFHESDLFSSLHWWQILNFLSRCSFAVLCEWSNVESCLFFRLLCSACHLQSESRFHLSNKNFLLLSCCFRYQRLIHTAWKALLIEGKSMAVGKPFLSGGDFIHCFTVVEAFTYQSWVRISVFRNSNVVLVVVAEVVMCWQFEKLLAAVSWHRSTALQKQGFFFHRHGIAYSALGTWICNSYPCLEEKINLKGQLLTCYHASAVSMVVQISRIWRENPKRYHIYGAVKLYLTRSSGFWVRI